LGGDILVECLSDIPDRLATLHEVRCVARNGAARMYTIARAGRTARGDILHLAGVEDRTGAEALAGCLLEVPRAEAPPLPQGQYYIYQVIGLEVVSDDGQELGRIVEVLQPGANDVYVVHGAKGEILLPGIEHVVRQVDLAAGRMTVHVLPGLIQEK
jgi:16S rRNA processing protein RimM